MNYFVWGALHFNDRVFQAELMFHASLMGHRIDLQTYLKIQLNLYYNEDIEDRSE